MSIHSSFVEKLKDQISVSDVVSKKVKLTKKGKDYFGRCPFHSEQTPSFSVNNSKKFYHCFGCGANGDIINFIEKTQNLDFVGAVKYIAQEYNIALPDIDESKHALEMAIENINAVAAKWFYRNLHSPQNKEYLDYLNNRSISNDYIKKFFLGYAPNTKSELINYLIASGYKKDEIANTGLVTQLDNGEIIDKFRGRIMFPIANIRGKIVGFGGRALHDVQPKYLNSPETAAFKKKQILYNENILFKELRDSKNVYVFEGYTDVISVYMSGIKNVVATLGTAISEYNIEKLWKITESPTICMDGDAAGMKAMIRVVDVVLPILKPGYSINFVKMPEGLDPDDFVKNNGKDALLKIFEQKIDLCDAIWNVNVSTADFKTPEKQALFKQKLMEVVNKVQDASVKKFYTQYFNDKVFQLFYKTTKKSESVNFAPRNNVSALGAQVLPTIEKCRLTLLAIVIDNPYILTQHSIHDEFFSIDLESDYFNKVHRSISDVFSKMDEALNEEEFNQNFASLLKNTLDASIIEHLSGKKSYFLDKISVKSFNNVVISWNKTFARYNLELLKVDYIKSLQAMDENSTEISARLKKQIIEQEKRISANSN